MISSILFLVSALVIGFTGASLYENGHPAFAMVSFVAAGLMAFKALVLFVVELLKKP